MKTYLNELFKRMDLIKYLVLSGLKSQHKNTYLGFFWWLLDPALQIVIYYFVVVVVFQRARGVNYGIYLAMAPETAQEIINALQKAVDKAAAQNVQPTIVCSPGVRRHLRRLVDRHLPTLRVLSHHELVTEAKIQSLGIVSLGHEA